MPSSVDAFVTRVAGRRLGDSIGMCLCSSGALSMNGPSNYRGLHLTTVLSKVAQRVIGSPLELFLQERGRGDSQWAFRGDAGAKDLVTIAVARWGAQVCQDEKVGVHLADISGAFDKVSRERLMAKLAALGVAPAFLHFLNSYLQPHEGQLLVEVAISKALVLRKMVFQGTVLGPRPWIHFSKTLPQASVMAHMLFSFFVC